MGFLSVLGKIGKGALKVAKYAAVPALAATGVGLPAAIALGAGLSAADKKASGGSWGDALKAGAIGGATSAIPGMGGVGGLAKGGLSLPGGIAASAGGEALGGAANSGLLGTLGKVGASALTGGAGLKSAGGLMNAAGTVGEMLGGGAAAAKEGRQSDAVMQSHLNQGNNAANLGAAQFNAGQQGNLIKRALAARMLQDRQAPSDPRAAKFYQGPSAELKAMAEKYGGMADADVMSGSYRLNPAMSSVAKPGVMEKIGAVGGTAGGMLDVLRKMRQPQAGY